jgi:hypothetical protein
MRGGSSAAPRDIVLYRVAGDKLRPTTMKSMTFTTNGVIITPQDQKQGDTVSLLESAERHRSPSSQREMCPRSNQLCFGEFFFRFITNKKYQKLSSSPMRPMAQRAFTQRCFPSRTSGKSTQRCFEHLLNWLLSPFPTPCHSSA